MKVQALVSTYINATYRSGPTRNLEGEVTKPGDVFDVADDYIVNRTVLRVVKPPADGKVRFVKLQEIVPPPVEVVVEHVEEILDASGQLDAPSDAEAAGAVEPEAPKSAAAAASALSGDPVLGKPAAMNPPVQGRAPATPASPPSGSAVGAKPAGAVPPKPPK